MAFALLLQVCRDKRFFFIHIIIYYIRRKQTSRVSKAPKPKLRISTYRVKHKSANIERLTKVYNNMQTLIMVT